MMNKLGVWVLRLLAVAAVCLLAACRVLTID